MKVCEEPTPHATYGERGRRDGQLLCLIHREEMAIIGTCGYEASFTRLLLSLHGQSSRKYRWTPRRPRASL